jgi:recombination protein RecA
MPQIERDERQEREKIKAVDLAVGQIEKQFGKGSIMRLGQKGAIQPIDAIPTARSASTSRSASAAPRGRVVEIFGPESSGNHALAAGDCQAQKLAGWRRLTTPSMPRRGAQRQGRARLTVVSQPDNASRPSKSSRS